jgi:hypothetical protein
MNRKRNGNIDKWGMLTSARRRNNDLEKEEE